MSNYYGLIFIIAVGIFLAVSAVVSSDLSKRKKKCKAPVTATIVDLQMSQGIMDGDYYNYRYPVLEYDYAGKLYRQRSNVCGDCRTALGKQITIYVDPLDPTYLYIPTLNPSTYAASPTIDNVLKISFLIVGILMIIWGVMLCTLLSATAGRALV